MKNEWDRVKQKSKTKEKLMKCLPQPTNYDFIGTVVPTIGQYFEGKRNRHTTVPIASVLEFPVLVGGLWDGIRRSTLESASF